MNWKRKDEKLPCRGKLQFEDLIRRLLAGETVPSGPQLGELKSSPFFVISQSVANVLGSKRPDFAGGSFPKKAPLQAIVGHP